MTKFILLQFQVYRMEGGSRSDFGGHEPGWKYCTPFKGNRNDTICNYCGLVMKSGGITRLKFHLSHVNPHSNSKKCLNMPLEMKQQIKMPVTAKR